MFLNEICRNYNAGEIGSVSTFFINVGVLLNIIQMWDSIGNKILK